MTAAAAHTAAPIRSASRTLRGESPGSSSSSVSVELIELVVEAIFERAILRALGVRRSRCARSIGAAPGPFAREEHEPADAAERDDVRQEPREPVEAGVERHHQRGLAGIAGELEVDDVLVALSG